MVSPFTPTNPYLQSSGEADGLGPKMMNGLINAIAGGEPEETVDAAAVQDRFNNHRDTVRRRAGELGYDGEFRPQEVLNTDDFAGDVATLRAKVDKIDLTAVENLRDGWKKIAERNTTSLTEFQGHIARGTAPDVWRGAASTAAAQTVADYQTTGNRVTTAAALTGHKVDELLTGLEPTKQLVPHAPEHRSGVDNLRSWVTFRGWRNDDVAEENAAAEARRVLKTVYAQVVHDSDKNVPVIPLPEPIGSGDGDGGPVVGGGGDNGSSGGDRPAGADPGAAQPNTSEPAATQDPTAGTGQPGNDTGQASQDPRTDTAPQSAGPATTPASTPAALGLGSPGLGSPGLGSPGGSPGGGSPGLGSGGLGAGGGAGLPGAAVPGGPGGPGSAAAARAAGAGAGSAAGRAGMMGGAPGAGRGKGEDDESTKGIPDYLITQDNSDELTGLADLPKTVPPVIGA
ncbi:hypothetical protein ACFO5K_14915 [Nocardia halotolerans]|uniref:PPE family protein n=1 Tax=Nocardia halotolerans TaxID=1755878 RepID=A0ABV8VH90_9NOCA